MPKTIMPDDIPPEVIERTRKILGISGDDIRRFLKSSPWNDFECEVCGKDQFSIGFMGDFPSPISLVSSVNTAYAKWVFSIICVECGNLKLLDVETVRDWLKENSQ